MAVLIAVETPRRDGVRAMIAELDATMRPVAPCFGSAWRLDEQAGFTVCGTALDYSDSGHSRFYEKKLA